MSMSSNAISLMFVAGSETARDEFSPKISSVLNGKNISFKALLTNQLTSENVPDVILLKRNTASQSLDVTSLSLSIREKVGKATQKIIIVDWVSDAWKASETEVADVLTIPTLSELVIAVQAFNREQE